MSSTPDPTPRQRDPTASGPAIAIEGATKRFGSVTAVEDLSLQVATGEVFGLLGPNGAGKTTAIDLILGLTAPTDGTVRVFGVDPLRRGMEVRNHTGIVMQQSALDAYLTGRENVRIYAELYLGSNSAARRRVDEVLTWTGLSSAADRLVKGYSGGMRRRLDLAIGALHRPRLLLLDEPTLGLDVQTRHEVWRLVRDMAAHGTTVLLTTHYLEEADHLCDRVGILNHGHLVALDTPAQLRSTIVGDLHRLTLRCAEPCDGTSLELPAMFETTDNGMVLSGAPEQLWRSLALLRDAYGENLLEVTYAAPTLDDVVLRLTTDDPHEAAGAR
ncbi:MAG: ABC transporter ATP-binding protein [Deinococcales bacterium]